jgi:hypothetical protein
MQDTKTRWDINRRHSERDCHRSITTHLWNADMPTSSNNIKVSVYCCHSKHMGGEFANFIVRPLIRIRLGYWTPNMDPYWCNVSYCVNCICIILYDTLHQYGSILAIQWTRHNLISLPDDPMRPKHVAGNKYSVVKYWLIIITWLWRHTTEWTPWRLI